MGHAWTGGERPDELDQPRAHDQLGGEMTRSPSLSVVPVLFSGRRHGMDAIAKAIRHLSF